MNDLILVCGNLGSTLKCAEILKRRLNGDSCILQADDTAEVKAALAEKDEFDALIIGTNIRMGKPNKKFRKWAKIIRKNLSDKQIYVYMLCAWGEKSDLYIQKIRKILPCAKQIIYAGGVLNAEQATGFVRDLVVDIRKDFVNNGRQLPAIYRKSLESFADSLNKNRE